MSSARPALAGRFRLTVMLRPLAALAFLMAASAASAESYRVQPGDTLLVTVASIPEFSHRITVGIDGHLSVPLAGQLPVSGKTIDEVLVQLQSSLSTKVFRRRTEQGQEIPIVIGPDEVVVSVAEYRPVYINGDVSTPGEQPFRPGLTVRSAVSVAGGYDLARFRMNNPFVELADLRAEHDTLQAEQAKMLANVLRIEAELAGKAEFQDGALRQGPISPKLVEQIVSVEERKLETRQADLKKEKAYLAAAIEQENGRTESLAEQQRQEEEGAREDVNEFNRMRELFEKGSVPSTRLTEARRSLLLSSTRSLQTGVQLAQVERERSSLGRKLEQIDDQRKLALLDELQDAQVQLANVRSKLQAVNDKLQYTGMVRSQLVRGNGAKPNIVVVRRTGDSVQRLTESEDYVLQPGDIVEVSLQSDLVPQTRADAR